MHIFLLSKIPGMSFIPGTDDEFATIEKARSSQLGWRVGFMPRDELKGIKEGVKGLMPLT